ncbi:LOG family protein [Rickettsiales bacterium LUAb2]
MLKSYENPAFMNSRTARPLRILSEFIEPESRLAKYNIENIIVFFGSARILPEEAAKKELELALASKDQNRINTANEKLASSKYYEQTVALSNRLANWSKEHGNNFFICSGGGPGIMEAANKGAYLAGCHNIGFNINLPFEQYANPYITPDLIFNFNYFFMRKFWFTYLAKAIIVFPGGFGTIDELAEVLTLIQTKKVTKHLPIVLFGNNFFNELINFDFLEKNHLINKEDRDIFFQTSDLDEAFNYITERLEIYNKNE